MTNENYEELYRTEYTKESYKEMIKFCDWLNEIYGFYPVIVGGWAVYHYAPPRGSRDIDVILPTRESVDKIMLQWYDLSGYRSEGFFERTYYKAVETSQGNVRIEMDVSSYQQKNSLKENPSLEIPWSLCEKHFETWILEKSGCRVPTIELLLILKTKALRDRKYDRETKILSRLEREHIASKIWKDETDIKALCSKQIDWKTVLKLAKKQGVNDIFRQEWDRLKVR